MTIEVRRSVQMIGCLVLTSGLRCLCNPGCIPSAERDHPTCSTAHRPLFCPPADTGHKKENLEHLKKQARKKLRELQALNPGAQLADAQHAVAQDYGFASWPKLKAHVEGLTSTGEPSPAYHFERYSERAKRATFFSRWEASQIGSRTIECEHLLIGVVRARQDLASARPSCFAPPVAEVRAVVTAGSSVMPALLQNEMIPFSDTTKSVLARAAEVATSLTHSQIGTWHLLLALSQRAPSTVTRILSQYDASEQWLQDNRDVLLPDG